MKTTTPSKPVSPSKPAPQNTTLGISLADVGSFQTDWLNCFPAELTDLFFYQTSDGLKIQTTYELDTDAVNQIINTLGGTNGNVSQLAIIMGCKTTKNSRDFQPILEVTLYKKQAGKDVYYFLMTPVKDAVVISQERLNAFAYIGRNSDEDDAMKQISPKIAEILMMNWLSLSNEELVNAFDAVTPNSITLVDTASGAQILFGDQKVRRVNKYTFGNEESEEIVAEMAKAQQEGLTLKFRLQMGSGLVVPDLHPFNFRPIINIYTIAKSGSNKLTSRRNIVGSRSNIAEDGNNVYFDTSRPCPPFCKPRNDG